MFIKFEYVIYLSTQYFSIIAFPNFTLIWLSVQFYVVFFEPSYY